MEIGEGLRVEKWEGLWVGKRVMGRGRVKGGKKGRAKVVKRKGLRVGQR